MLRDSHIARHGLETNRLNLRRWTADDVDPFAALCADPDVMKFIGSGATLTAEQAKNAVTHFESQWAVNGFGLFAVELKRSKEMIGFTGLSRPTFLPEILPSIEIGWRLAKRHWGNGYATEAATAVLSFAVDTLALRDIVSIYQTGNIASERILLKLGMVFDRQTLDPSSNRQVNIYRLPPKT